MTSLKPMRDRVLVLQDAEKRMQGGLHLPDTTTEKPAQGEVVDVGDGRIIDSGLAIPLTLKVGDRVLFAKYAGIEVQVDGSDYRLLREDEILGVFKKEKEQAVGQAAE